jgi:hypothetical protein
MKTDGGVVVELHPFLTSAVDGNEWLASRPAEIVPVTFFIVGQVGTRSNPSSVKKNNLPLSGIE